MRLLFFLSIVICMSFSAFAGEKPECLEQITFKSHILEQDPAGEWFWRGSDNSSNIIYLKKLVCVENGFTPRMPRLAYLPSLEMLGHFSDQVNYGVEDLILPNLRYIETLLISSASYPNMEIRRVDLSRLKRGNLLLSAGDLAPNLEAIKINRIYWEGLSTNDGKKSVETNCRENIRRSSKRVIYFNCK